MILISSQGCGFVQEIAAAAAERATSRGIAEGKAALQELGEQANRGIRDLGADLYQAGKQGLQETGNIAAFKAGEAIEDNLEKYVGEGASSKAQELALQLLQSRGSVDGTGAVVKPPEEMSLFDQILLGLVGTATTAVTGGAMSTSSRNRHDKRITRKQFEASLRNAPVPITVVPNGNGRDQITGAATVT